MNRFLFNSLQAWLKDSDRKPLVLRGARQVGKTWLVRTLAELNQKKLIELNFERQPSLISLFNSNDPKQIIKNISASLSGESIEINQSVLFLDEIQAAPQLLAQLRWFAEEMPELPVIAAGSLLEFVLKDHTFSMPVGRIQYQHLEPLSFEEFLLALNQKNLVEYLNNFELKLGTQNHLSIPELIHENLMQFFREYLIVGGMPAVINSWVKESSWERVAQVQQDLLTTYRDDFSKYRSRFALERLDEILWAVPKMLGEKFVASRASRTAQTSTVKQILELFEKARLCHSVTSVSANGVPLGAEVKDKFFKEIFLDVGLCSTALSLNLHQLNQTKELVLVNSGGLAEQVVGQLLRTLFPSYIEPVLYYWTREESGKNSEIDYIMALGNQVIPIEVKAGATGSLKSLHYFMETKKFEWAVRINSDKPSCVEVDLKGFHMDCVKYKLASLPFYLIGQLPRLLRKLLGAAV